MPRERSNTLRKSSPNEIQVGDQVMVLCELQNREPMLAQIVEIKQVEINNKPSTSNVIKMEVDEQTTEIIDTKKEEKREESINTEENKREGYLNYFLFKIPKNFLVSTSGGEESQSESKEREGSPETIFYVHYVGTDRRLDEWVPKSRILRQANYFCF